MLYNALIYIKNACCRPLMRQIEPICTTLNGAHGLGVGSSPACGARTPIHPGEIFADEFEELGVSPTELSRQIRVPANRISQIINRNRRNWST